MNRNSAKQGIISPKEIRKYRKGYPVRLKEWDHSMYKNNQEVGGFTRARAPLPSDANPNFTYGKPTRYFISKKVPLLQSHY